MEERRIQDLHSAVSRRSWQDVEKAADRIRDDFHREAREQGKTLVQIANSIRLTKQRGLYEAVWVEALSADGKLAIVCFDDNSNGKRMEVKVSELMKNHPLLTGDNDYSIPGMADAVRRQDNFQREQQGKKTMGFLEAGQGPKDIRDDKCRANIKLFAQAHGVELKDEDILRIERKGKTTVMVEFHAKVGEQDAVISYIRFIAEDDGIQF